MRVGTVAIIGRTNVGKSTLLNAALGQELAIASRLPQTTRDVLLGIAHTQTAQIAFMDTPGIHRPRTELGRRMNAYARDTARHTDAAVFMTDVECLLRPGPRNPELQERQWANAEDRRLLEVIPAHVPALLVLNKVDLLHDKRLLLPLTEELNTIRDFAATIPTSARSGEGVEHVLSELERLLPERDRTYDEDELTDRPVRFFVSEYVREAVLEQSRKEVPHAVAVTVDEFHETPEHLSIVATVHVEKVGQRRILIGTRGERVKAIGTRARQRIEALTGKSVYLTLHIKLNERWRDLPRRLSELGYESQAAGSSSDRPSARAPGKQRRPSQHSPPKASS